MKNFNQIRDYFKESMKTAEGEGKNAMEFCVGMKQEIYNEIAEAQNDFKSV